MGPLERLTLTVPCDVGEPGETLVPSVLARGETSVFTSTYHDTGDRALAALCITLARRVENGKSRWVLELADGRTIERTGGPAAPPARLAALVAGVLRGAELDVRATVRTRRVRAALDGAEIVVDRVAVRDDGRVESALSHVSIDPAPAAGRDLARFLKALRKAGARRVSSRAELLSALGLGTSSSPTPAASAPPLAFVAASLDVQYRQILAHDPGVRLGDDAEDVHQMRVAVRRARAVLRAARPILDAGPARTLAEELAWLGDLLGPVRDLDVLLEHLRDEVAALPDDDRFAAERLVQVLADERSIARADLLEGLESERYENVLDQLAEAARAPAGDSGGASLVDLAAAAFARLEKRSGALPATPSDEDLHSVRVAAKRARYAAELAEPAAGKAAKRFVGSAKRLQDVAGEHQDAAVAVRRIRDLLSATRGSRVAFAAGRLVEREETRRREARAAFPAALAAARRSGRHAWT